MNYGDVKRLEGEWVRLEGDGWGSPYGLVKRLKWVSLSDQGNTWVGFEGEPEEFCMADSWDRKIVKAPEPKGEATRETGALPQVNIRGTNTPTTHDTDYNYYMLPNGVETRDVSQFLTSFAGQIVQYAIRSGRTDGKVKSHEDRARDFDKIADFAKWEAKRIREHGA